MGLFDLALIALSLQTYLSSRNASRSAWVQFFWVVTCLVAIVRALCPDSPHAKRLLAMDMVFAVLVSCARMSVDVALLVSFCFVYGIRVVSFPCVRPGSRFDTCLVFACAAVILNQIKSSYQI
jgi:hypothetical protein